MVIERVIDRQTSRNQAYPNRFAWIWINNQIYLRNCKVLQVISLLQIVILYSIMGLAQR